MNVRALRAVALACLLGACARAGQFEHELRLAEPVGLPRRAEPVAVGVPLPRGLAADTRQFRLLDAQGREVLAQCRELSRWWPRSESIRWLLVQFLADCPAGGRAVYRLVHGVAPAEAKTPLVVRERPDHIDVVTGRARFRFAKGAFRLFDGIWADANGDGRFDEREALLAKNPYDGATLTDTFGKRYYTHTTPPVVRIEEDGPVRVVLRFQGSLAAEDGERLHAYLARVFLYAGHSVARVDFTLKNTAHEGQGIACFRDLSLITSIRLQGKQKRYWLFGDTLHAGTLPADRTVYLYQDSSGGPAWELKAFRPYPGPGYRGRTFRGYHVTLPQPFEKPQILASGDRALGQATLLGERLGVTVACRHFWEQAPKGIELDASGQVFLRLWPADFKGSHFLTDMTQKTHKLLYVFHAAADATAAHAALPKTLKPLFAPGTADVVAFHNPLVVRLPAEACLLGGGGLPAVAPAPRAALPALLPSGRLAERLVQVPRRLRDFVDADTDADLEARGCFAWQNFCATAALIPAVAADRTADVADPRRYTHWSPTLRYLATGQPAARRLAEAVVAHQRDLLPYHVDGLDVPVEIYPASRHKSDRTAMYNDFLAARAKAQNRRRIVGQPVYDYGWHMPPVEQIRVDDLAHHYFATGERLSREALADLVRRHLYFFAWHPKGTKLPPSATAADAAILLATTLAYEVTGDDMIRQVARQYAARIIAACDPLLGPPLTTEHADEARRILASAGLGLGGRTAEPALVAFLLTGLQRLHEIEPDEDLHDRILGMADWLVHDAAASRGGLPPLWAPEIPRDFYRKLDARHARGCAGPVAWACRATGNQRYLSIGDRCLAAMTLEERARALIDPSWQLYFQERRRWRSDPSPPARVDSLDASAQGGSVRLTWRAPHDAGPAGTEGRVVAYQLKHAPLPIVEHAAPSEIATTRSFWAAANVPGEPAPLSPRRRQEMTVSGLKPGTHYFALKARDAAGNWSTLSNVARAQVR